MLQASKNYAEVMQAVADKFSEDRPSTGYIGYETDLTSAIFLGDLKVTKLCLGMYPTEIIVRVTFLDGSSYDGTITFEKEETNEES